MDDILRIAQNASAVVIEPGARLIFWTPNAVSMETTEKFRKHLAALGVDGALISSVSGVLITRPDGSIK